MAESVPQEYLAFRVTHEPNEQRVNREVSLLTCKVGAAIVDTLRTHLLVDPDGIPIVPSGAKLAHLADRNAPGAPKIPSLRLSYPDPGRAYGDGIDASPSYWLLDKDELSRARPSSPRRVAEACQVAAQMALDGSAFWSPGLHGNGVFRSGPQLTGAFAVRWRLETIWQQYEEMPLTAQGFVERISAIGNEALGRLTGSNLSGGHFGVARLLAEEYQLPQGSVVVPTVPFERRGDI